MGSWSERCMITDCEISEGTEMYVVGLTRGTGSANDGSFSRWRISTTLLKGVYNDYGRMRVTDTPENLELFNRTAELDITTIFSGDYANHADGYVGGMQYMYFRADALDMLRSIRVEFVWNGITRCGDYETECVTNLSRIQTEEISAEETDDKIIAMINLLNNRILLQAIDQYFRGNVTLQRQIEDILTNRPELKQALFNQIAMITLIQGGMSELRKDIHPQNPTGPQHNGWDAVEDFANWLLKTAAAEKNKWNNDDE